MLKKLDLMILKGFAGPFIASFFIALFVLVMQTLWLYIDDIIGKGAGAFVILEFLFYLSLSLVPLALPIGVLLAGVFLFGNLGERYELSSIKSAGVSLIRVMMPMIFISLLISISSLVFSDFIIPKANLKFLSRLHDIKRQKPTLSLEEGVFNDDFYGYVIRIEKKLSDGKTIRNVLVDDHSNYNSKSTISAREGRMYVTQGGKFLVMELNNGELYQVPERGSVSNALYPFIRTRFDTLLKVFALDEFNLERSDEDLFKNNQRMKNSIQLRAELDSITRERDQNLPEVFSRYVRDFQSVRKRAERLKSDSLVRKTVFSAETRNSRIAEAALLVSNDASPDSILATLHSEDPLIKSQLVRKSIDMFRRDFDSNSGFIENEKNLDKKAAKFGYELFIKYSYALVCLLFVFVGAPLGAIVRKGGYGYPLIICMMVFVIYILLNTFFKRLSEGLSISAEIGAWLPCVIILIPGIFLTWTAQLDLNPISWIKLRIKKR